MNPWRRPERGGRSGWCQESPLGAIAFWHTTVNEATRVDGFLSGEGSASATEIPMMESAEDFVGHYHTSLRRIDQPRDGRVVVQR